MFTATAKQYQCSVCLRAKQVFEESARFYQSQFDLNSSSPSQRIVFFRIEVDNARNTFSDMSLETVPRVYLLPPTVEKSLKKKISDFEVESKILLEGPKAVLEEIEAKIGVKVRVTVAPRPLLMGLGAAGLLLALLVSAAAKDPSSAVFWYQSPYLWVIVSTVTITLYTVPHRTDTRYTLHTTCSTLF
jgi:hypothetical protein